MKVHGGDRLEKATYQPGDYGRMIRADGTEQWWVRSPKGTWVALRHSGLCQMRMEASRCYYWRSDLPYVPKTLGLTIPPSLLLRADQVLE
jgi:hypothetical protein